MGIRSRRSLQDDPFPLKNVVWADLPFNDNEHSAIFKSVFRGIVEKSHISSIDARYLLFYPWFFTTYKHKRFLQMLGERWIPELFQLDFVQTEFSPNASYERIMRYFEHFDWRYVDGELLQNPTQAIKTKEEFAPEELDEALKTFLSGEKRMIRELVFKPKKGIQYYQALQSAKDCFKVSLINSSDSKSKYNEGLSSFFDELYIYAKNGKRLFEGLIQELEGITSGENGGLAADMIDFENHHQFLKVDWISYFRESLSSLVAEALENRKEMNTGILRKANDLAISNCLLNDTVSSKYLCSLFDPEKDIIKALGLEDRAVHSVVVSSELLKEKVSALLPGIPVNVSLSRAAAFIVFLVTENPALAFQVRPAELWDRVSNMDPRIVNLQDAPPVGGNLFETMCNRIKGQKPFEERKMEPEKAYFAIGDIHGDKTTLLKILFSIYMGRNPEQVVIFFLGDYVDRGAKDTYVLSIVFSLYLTFPDNIVLLKGNHEHYLVDQGRIRPTFQPSHFYNDYYDVLEEHGMARLVFIDLFGSLKTYAILENPLRKEKILLAHAGIPDSVYVRNVQRFEETLSLSSQLQQQFSLAYSAESNFLWRDPSDVSFNDGTPRYVFTYEEFYFLMKQFGLNRMIRSHEYDSETREGENRGYRIHFEKYPGSVITIFSTGSDSEDTHYTEVSKPSFAQILNDGTIKVLTL